MQDHLAEVAQAFLVGDFDRYLACVSLPLEVKTRVAHLWIEDCDMLEEGFEAYSEALEALGVDRIELKALSVSACTNQTITGRYSARLMRRRDLMVPVYTSGLTMERHDLHWKTRGFSLPSSDTRWPLMPHKLIPA